MAPVPAKADSVYDVLYADLTRIRLFNSQFSQYGHITELTREISTSEGSTSGFDLKVMKTDTEQEETTAIAKKYDTQYVAPLTFLDNAKGMFVKDLTDAKIGQFVLIAGTLTILDLIMMKDAWSLSSVKNLIATGAKTAVVQNAQNREQRRQAAKSVGGESSLMNFMFEMLKIMPHSTQAVLKTAAGEVWSSLKPDAFITQPSDLTLTHGAQVRGTWNMVGILDAKPDYLEFDKPDEVKAQSIIGNLASIIQPLARQQLGRPEGAYGVTPVLIFREVTA